MACERDSSSAAYTSDLRPLQECGPKLWIYGDTHVTRDFTVGRTRVHRDKKAA